MKVKPAEQQPVKDEAWWRKTLAEARSKLERSKAAVEALDNRIYALQLDFYSRSEQSERDTIAREIEKVMAEKDKNYREMEDATATLAGLDETGALGRIPQSVPEGVDCSVEAAVKAYKGIGPQLPVQFLAGDDTTRLVQKHFQDLKRLLLEPQPYSALAQFACLQVHLERAETQTTSWRSKSLIHDRGVPLTPNPAPVKPLT